MFFQGSLQDGIAAAVQQSKLVVCFVTDGQEESQLWENEFITNSSIASSLEKDSILLRLGAGSQEAGYLAAIFPLPKVPTLVIIKNSDLKEYIAAGVTKEEFVRRVSAAFQASQTTAQAASSSSLSASASSSPAQATTAETSVVAGGSVQDEQTEAERVTRQQTQTRELALEGERRRQAARKAQEREKIEKQRKAKGKMPAEEGNDKPKAIDAVTKASQQLAERKRVAREERRRVLKLIEDDKAERKARDEMRRAEREAERKAAAGGQEESAGGATSLLGAGSAGLSSQNRRRHDQCSLQVRLFDGSTIRTRLSSKSNIRHVRKWIDENRRDGKDPYTFKVILTPLPNRNIDVTEEDKPLDDLELTPSSTLVLVPIDRHSAAYGGVNGNIISRLIAAIVAFFAYILGFFGGSESATRPAPERVSQQQSDGQQSSRIKGFNNPNDQRDQQLYNGNSLNFEPRKDDDDEKKS